MIKPRYIEFTAETNAVDYLARGCQFSLQALNEPRWWKWTALALHGALYGFAVCAVYGTDYSSVLTKGGRLIAIDSALARTRSPRSAEENESIRKLKSLLRNEFAHFVPKTWSIEVHGMPKIVIDILAVVGRLSQEGNVPRRLARRERVEVVRLVNTTSLAMKKSSLHFGSELAKRKAKAVGADA